MNKLLRVQIEIDRGDLKLRIDFDADEGETIAIVGPNGSGKSTLLHCVAGLVVPDHGEIFLGTRALDHDRQRVPAHERCCALLFQNHELFPHLNVLDNVAFSLGVNSSKKASRSKARSWLDKLSLTQLTNSMPSELSGGQTQRVALARALASEPDLLLLDEPLSALDLQATQDLRRLLREILQDFSGVTLFVTHEPSDALALAGRILVLEAGVVTQFGTADELREHPATPYVAEFVGLNRLVGIAHGDHVVLEGSAELTIADDVSGAVAVLIHPRAVAIHTSHPEGSPRNVLPAKIVHLERQVHRTRVTLEGPLPIVAELTPKAVESLGLQIGSEVWLAIKATEIVVRPE